jgi:hypothetical protein
MPHALPFGIEESTAISVKVVFNVDETIFGQEGG